MARTQKKPITNEFILQLLSDLECGKSLSQLSDKTGVDVHTLRTWAFEKSSPESTLEIVAGLENATGLTAAELLAQYRSKKAG